MDELYAVGRSSLFALLSREDVHEMVGTRRLTAQFTKMHSLMLKPIFVGIGIFVLGLCMIVVGLTSSKPETSYPQTAGSKTGVARSLPAPQHSGPNYVERGCWMLVLGTCFFSVGMWARRRL